MLDKSPREFTIEEYGWLCKLSFEGYYETGKYLLWINGILATDLPAAPLLKKENIPVVCQSDNLVFSGVVMKRVTFQLFIDGLLH